jgi:surface carbohydrate biosynthesis protein
MNKKLIICFPIEIKDRELYPKLLVAYYLLKTKKIDVIIGDKKNFFIDTEKSKNLIVFWKGGGKHIFNLYHHLKKNNFIFNLDEEGPISLMNKHDLALKVNIFVHKYMDKIFLWGNDDFKIYSKKDKNKKKDIKIFGHPKLDLLKKPFIKIFEKQLVKIKKKYKSFIFIPSHYTVDNIINDENYFLYVKKLYNLNNNTIEKIIKNEKQNFNNLVKVLIELANNNPEKLFIFRPHPGQSIIKVKKRFGKIPKNLKIIFKYTVTPWIIACEKYIHSGCTTVFEAATLNKKILYFSNKDKFDKVWSKIGLKVNISNNSNIKNIFKERIKKLNYHLLEKIIKNINKENSFCKSFSNFLITKNFRNFKSEFHIRKYDTKKNNYNIFLSYIKSQLLKNRILSKILAYYDVSLVFNKEMKNSKLSKLSKNEILNPLNSFKNFDKFKINFGIKKISKNIFKISS